MPVPVEQTIKVRELRPHDVVPQGDGDELVVARIERKQVWATVTFGNDSDELVTKRMRQDDDVTVRRMELTDEEKEQQRREFVMNGLRDLLTQLLTNTPHAALKKILTDADDRYDVLTWSNLPDVLKTQARWQCGMEIRRIVQILADQRHLRVDVDHPIEVIAIPDGVLFDAWAVWLYDTTTSKKYDHPLDPMSRSTSVVDNLLTDLERWAPRSIVADWQLLRGRDDLERRAVELADEAKRCLNV